MNEIQKRTDIEVVLLCCNEDSTRQTNLNIRKFDVICSANQIKPNILATNENLKNILSGILQRSIKSNQTKQIRGGAFLYLVSPMKGSLYFSLWKDWSRSDWNKTLSVQSEVIAVIAFFDTDIVGKKCLSLDSIW